MSVDPNAIDDAILNILDKYYEGERQVYLAQLKIYDKDLPDHIYHSLKLLKDLYDNGGPQKNF